MSTPEQPNTPPLTRKQLRELRNTGATPIVTTDAATDEPDKPVAAPFPRPAQPAAVPAAPVADAAVDLGAAPLTRRQARQQERIRTASVPVITPDLAAAHAASIAAVTPIVSTPAPAEEEADAADELRDLFGPVDEAEETVEADAVAESVEADAAAEEPEGEPAAAEVESVEVEVEPDEAEVAPDDEAGSDEVEASEAQERTVSPALGAGVIAGEPVQIDLPPSFDQLLARGSTGATAMPNALILSQTTGDLPIVAPVTATGDVLVTGTFNLPDGLGSTGHAHGTADGKDVDAVLVDGELPAHSSPTPIAASAAVSTIKAPGDVIKPPVPERGGRLMMWLAITAGVLALALVGVLILAFVTGLF